MISLVVEAVERVGSPETEDARLVPPTSSDSPRRPPLTTPGVDINLTSYERNSLTTPAVVENPLGIERYPLISPGIDIDPGSYARFLVPELQRAGHPPPLLDQNLPTIPTRTSWWTGRYGFTHRPWSPLRTDDLVLPALLWEQAVHSAFITDTYHMHTPGFGFELHNPAWPEGIMAGEGTQEFLVDVVFRVQVAR